MTLWSKSWWNEWNDPSKDLRSGKYYSKYQSLDKLPRSLIWGKRVVFSGSSHCTIAFRVQFLPPAVCANGLPIQNVRFPLAFTFWTLYVDVSTPVNRSHGIKGYHWYVLKSNACNSCQYKPLTINCIMAWWPFRYLEVWHSYTPASSTATLSKVCDVWELHIGLPPLCRHWISLWVTWRCVFTDKVTLSPTLAVIERRFGVAYPGKKMYTAMSGYWL